MGVRDLSRRLALQLPPVSRVYYELTALRHRVGVLEAELEQTASNHHGVRSAQEREFEGLRTQTAESEATNGVLLRRLNASTADLCGAREECDRLVKELVKVTEEREAFSHAARLIQMQVQIARSDHQRSVAALARFQERAQQQLKGAEAAASSHDKQALQRLTVQAERSSTRALGLERRLEVDRERYAKEIIQLRENLTGLEKELLRVQGLHETAIARGALLEFQADQSLAQIGDAAAKLDSERQRSNAEIARLRDEVIRSEKEALRLEGLRETEAARAALQAARGDRLDTELVAARRLADVWSGKLAELEVHRPSLGDVAAFSQRLAALSDSVLRPESMIEMEGKLLSRLSVLGYDVATLQRLATSEDKPGDETLRIRYLDLLEASLVGTLTEDPNMSPWGGQEFDKDRRFWGRDWPATALTMIGAARMRNVRALAQQIIGDEIPGDMLEAGVWRGGACIYMRGILAAHGVTDRKVWVADSFAGLPEPDEKRFPADRNDVHHTYDELIVPLDRVKRSFENYGLLDEQVDFLPGWFKDTLPGAPIEKLSLLRLDGDMYGSTMETLEALYPRVSPGGFIIIDDYILKPCAKAVNDYRRRFKIRDSLVDVDGAAVYWRKS